MDTSDWTLTMGLIGGLLGLVILSGQIYLWWHDRKSSSSADEEKELWQPYEDSGPFSKSEPDTYHMTYETPLTLDGDPLKP